MHRIDCPWCGVRDEAEFKYRGDATVKRPEPDAGAEAVEVATEGCVGDLLALREPVLQDGATAPGTPFGDHLDAGRIEDVPASVPLLIAHGQRDRVVPAAGSEAIAAALCDAGVPVQLQLSPGDDHGSVQVSSADDVLDWTLDRLAGAPPPSTC